MEMKVTVTLPEILDKIDISTFSVNPNDVIYVKLKPGADFSESEQLHKFLMEQFPNNKVITAPDNVDITTLNKEELE